MDSILSVVKEILQDLIAGVDLKTIVSVIIDLLIGYILLRIVKFIFKKLNRNKAIHIKFAHNILRGIIIVYTLYQVCIKIESLQTFITTVLASTSLLVVVAGFAAQEALSNVINGLFISIFKPFEIGDRIKLVSNSISGYIEDISLRHTIVRTFTNSRIIVPNSVMNKEMIENTYYKDSRASMWIDVNIGYTSDIKQAKEIMQRIIASHPLFLDIRTEKDIEAGKQAVPVSVRELGESGIALRATVWTNNIDDNFTACSDIRESIKEEFDLAGIEIPYNKLDIRGNIKITESESDQLGSK